MTGGPPGEPPGEPPRRYKSGGPLLEVGTQSRMPPTDASPTSENQVWSIVGRKIPRSECVYFSQILILYLTIIVCLINLSIGVEESEVWWAMLSSAIGYMLPHPHIKRNAA